MKIFALCTKSIKIPFQAKLSLNDFMGILVRPLQGFSNSKISRIQKVMEFCLVSSAKIYEI